MGAALFLALRFFGFFLVRFVDGFLLVAVCEVRGVCGAALNGGGVLLLGAPFLTALVGASSPPLDVDPSPRHFCSAVIPAHTAAPTSRAVAAAPPLEYTGAPEASSGSLSLLVLEAGATAVASSPPAFRLFALRCVHTASVQW